MLTNQVNFYQLSYIGGRWTEFQLRWQKHRGRCLYGEERVQMQAGAVEIAAEQAQTQLRRFLLGSIRRLIELAVTQSTYNLKPNSTQFYTQFIICYAMPYLHLLLLKSA